MTKKQAKKVLKAALYVGVSATIGYLTAWLQGNPEAFGIYTPIVNVTLVTIKQLFTVDEEA